MLNLLGVPYANCVTHNTRLYLNVFQKCSDFCGGNLRRERTKTFRGTLSAADVMRMDCESQKLKSTDAADVFQAYSALCSRGIGRRRSVNVSLNTTISSSNFIHDNDVCNTGPSTSRAGRNARENPEVDLTTGEATCSRGVRRRPSVNVHQTTTVCSPNFIHGNGTSYTYTNFRDSDQRCLHCGASFWYGECLKGHSHNQKPEYHLCCGRGSIYMQPSREPPEYIKSLFGNKHFMENIQAYNQMFAVTSFGAKIDESINVDRGPYVFNVSGQIYHWIGSLCPLPGEALRFLKLYIYDTDNEVENKMRHLSGIHNSDLDPQMVEGPIYFLDAYNELVQLFRTSRDKCGELDIPKFKIHLYNPQCAHGYEFPTSNTLGAMVFESGITSNTDFDVIIQHKDDPTHRVNKLHPSYLSLQFPILFIYGQSGYHTNLKLRLADSRGRARRGDSESKIKSAEDVDQYISAELPDQRIDPDGYNIVSEMMMHGPCGAANLNALCMKGDKEAAIQILVMHLQDMQRITFRDIDSLCSQGKIALAVASSSIASLLLPSGRTAHSRFKLPLELTEESLCRITKNTQLGKLLADTDLIIQDEAPMNDRRCSEALVRSLKDIVNRSSSLFGDIINSKVLDMVPGESTCYISQDEATPTGNDGAETKMIYLVEHLNTLKLQEISPHHLELKVGAPVILLRNVNLVEVLCNGTRMIVRQLMTKLIEV
nr:helitron helicase-like domain-containing protein [Tanacetum cinerariifolium]